MKYRLGDICTITKGETGIMKAIPGDYTMVALGEANKTHTEFQFDTKAVIIPLVSSTGHGHASMKRVKYQEGKFALGNILCAVIPKDEKFVLAKYLHIYLHWNREELLVSQMKGMANVSLSIGKIADVSVIVPSLEKQKQIVELEQKLVAKELIVEKLLTDQLTQLENLNQAILQEAVQGKLVKQNPKDEPASELLKRIKAEKAKSSKKVKPLLPIKSEEIPFEIPESWVWCRLGVMCINRDGERKPIAQSERNGRKKIYDYYGASGVIDKIDGYTHEGELLLIGEDGANLIARSTPIAFIAKGQFWVNNHAHVLDAVDRVTLDYLCCFINSMDLKPFVTGGFQPKLSQGDLNIMPVPLPPLSEQTRIVAEIEKQLAKTKQLKEHIIANQHATEQLLKALLHGAFEVEEVNKV
jgi:type I restriction enzyme S subunit